MSNDAEGASDAATEATADADDEAQADGSEPGQSTEETDRDTAQGQPAADRERSLSERVREEAGDGLADEVAELESRVDRLEAELADTDAELADANEEIEDLTERLQTKQADFQNYKQRAKRKQDQIRERATEDLTERLLGVRDNLGRALEEDGGDVDALREGVELTRKEFDRVLADEGVEEIRPATGEGVDAQRHEVMMRVKSDQPSGTVVDVYRPGYEMGGKVLRTAQVTVSDGGESGNGDSANEDSANEDSANEDT